MITIQTKIMKKDPKAFHTWLFILLCLIGSGWFQQAAGQATLPFPVAHYPLYMDMYRQFHVVQPWDVSGNARHGNTYDASANAFYDSFFDRDSFPNNKGIPCINKKGWDDAHINIPNPYPSFSSNENYTISFWVYWRGDMAFLDQTVIKIPDLEIRLQTQQVVLGINRATSMEQYSSIPVFQGEGWHFIAIASNHLFYVRKYENSQKVSFLQPGSSSNPYSRNISQLLDGSFRGEISQVRFYDATLNSSQLSAIYDEDLSWALHTSNDNIYVKKNMFSYYPMDGSGFNQFKTDAVTRFGNRDAISASGVTPAPDRYGKSDHALSFPQLNAYMQLPPFFDQYLNDYVQYSNLVQKGFTLSYWVYISPAESSPSGGIALPFTDNTPRQKIFYGVSSSNQDLFGMQKITDRLGIFRYNDIQPGNRYPWYLWLYDPLSFRNLSGWCHVIWVQYADWLRIYLYKPDGTSACQSIYLGIQDLRASNIADWGLGNRGGPSGTQTLVLDDFRVYNWPLRPEEVFALHASESPGTATPARACASCDMRSTATVINGATETTPDRDILVFPNPAGSQVTIKLPLKENTTVQVELLNTEGRSVLKRSYALQQGTQEIILDLLAIAAGSYFIHLTGDNLNVNRQLVIQK